MGHGDGGPSTPAFGLRSGRTEISQRSRRAQRPRPADFPFALTGAAAGRGVEAAARSRCPCAGWPFDSGLRPALRANGDFAAFAPSAAAPSRRLPVRAERSGRRPRSRSGRAQSLSMHGLALRLRPSACAQGERRFHTIRAERSGRASPDQPALRFAIHSSTRRSSSVSGSAPPPSTASWKPLMSKRAPSSRSAFLRRSWMRIMPTL